MKYLSRADSRDDRPNSRLILLAALIAPPALALVPLQPEFTVAAALVVAAGLHRGFSRWMGRIKAFERAPRRSSVIHQTYRGCVAPVPLIFQNSSPQPFAARIALALPEDVVSDQATLPCEAPPGRSSLEWPLTGMVRGERRLNQLHIENRSPLGLWNIHSARGIACELRVYPNLRDRASAALLQRGQRASACIGR